MEVCHCSLKRFVRNVSLKFDIPVSSRSLDILDNILIEKKESSSILLKFIDSTLGLQQFVSILAYNLL